MAGHIWTQSQAALEELLGTIEPVLGEVIVDRAIAYGELTLVVQGAEIVRALTFLRDEPGAAVQGAGRSVRRRLPVARAPLRRGLPPAVGAP